MRVAVCMSGHMRSYDKCFPPLEKYLLGKYQCDLFLATWNTRGVRNFKSKGAVADASNMHFQEQPITEDVVRVAFGDALKG